MKLNKTILIAAFASLAAIFTACKDPNKTPTERPKIISYAAYNANGDKIAFNLGDTNVDPTELKYIDFTCERSMDKNYRDFVFYGDILDQILNYGWVSSYTYRLVFNLAYSENIKIIFNDMAYYDEHRDLPLWRDEDGNFMKEFKIEFSTKGSPRTESEVFSFNTPEFLTRDLAINLGYNEYGNNDNDAEDEATGNMQAGLSIRNLFFPEKIKNGDTVKFTYKIKALKGTLPEIIVNLIDTNEAVDYWGSLSSVKDQIINQNKETDGDWDYYSGEMVFPITAEKIYSCTLQFTCKDPTVLSQTETIDFFICAGSN